MEWQEINDMNDTIWDYKKEYADAGNEMVAIEGILIGIKENVGVNNSLLYSIEKEDGTVWAVWGSTVLDSRLARVEPGEHVRIEYLGTQKPKKGGKPYHTFKVYHAPGSRTHNPDAVKDLKAKTFGEDIDPKDIEVPEDFVEETPF